MRDKQNPENFSGLGTDDTFRDLYVAAVCILTFIVLHFFILSEVL
jgi:hypothetical protein